MNYDEYLHCEHLYCWKHGKYWFNKYSKREDCKKENGIKGDLYWNDLAHQIVIQKKNEREAQSIKEMLGIKTSTEIPEPQIEPDHENLNTPLEESQQQISPPNQTVDELERQLKQIKLINEDYEKRCQELSEDLKTERKRTEALAEEIVKYELIEPMIIQKEESWCHCENCKETETYYEYCIPSIILLYKTLYSMEKSIREEKEKELNENDNLVLQINEEQAKGISEEELQQQAITLKQEIDELKQQLEQIELIKENEKISQKEENQKLNEELKGYHNFLKIFEDQETKENIETPIINQNEYQQILDEFDRIINPEYVC